MSSSNFIQNRLQHLDDFLTKNLDLLKEYEIALLYEDDPRRKEKYKMGIEQVRASVELYRREYDDLQRELQSSIGRPPTYARDVGLPFDAERLSKKLSSMQDVILGEVRGMQMELLDRYALGEKAMVQTIIEHFDQSQLLMLDELLFAVERQEIPQIEMEGLGKILQESLAALPPASIPNQEATKKLLSQPESNMSHKIKLSLPIIPAILSYEGEFEIGQKMQLISWIKSHIPRKKKNHAEDG